MPVILFSLVNILNAPIIPRQTYDLLNSLLSLAYIGSYLSAYCFSIYLAFNNTNWSIQQLQNEGGEGDESVKKENIALNQADFDLNLSPEIKSQTDNTSILPNAGINNSNV